MTLNEYSVIKQQNRNKTILKQQL